MNRREYDSITERELVGRYVVTAHELQNGTRMIAKGAILKITRKFGGFDLSAEPCTHCGVGVRITRVPFSDVDLLPKDFRPRP